MKRLVLLMTVLVLAFGSFAVAEVRIAGHSVSHAAYPGAHGLGLGIVLGNTNGLSIKNWVSQDHAFQFDAAWDLYNGGLGFGAAYLVHNFDIIEADNARFPLYFGIKGWAAMSNNSVSAGVQVPLGIAWIIRETAIDVFLQIEPGVRLIPDIRFAPGGGIGIRFWLS